MGAHNKLLRTLEILFNLDYPFGYSLEELAESYGMSTRTIRRYIDTFINAGFVIDRLPNGRYRLNVNDSQHNIDDLLHFSKEESYLLMQAINSVETNNVYREKLVSKLYSLYDFDRVPEAVTVGRQTEIVNILYLAIQQKSQVILKNYKSSSGNTIKDRNVEPMAFSTNYKMVWAFDLNDKKNKLFKTSRIDNVIITDKIWNNELKHKYEDVDVFRCSLPNKTKVDIELSLTAYSLLIEEYPLAQKDTFPTKNNCYALKTTVQGFEGVGRFMLGLIDHVVVLSPPELKDYLNSKIKNCKF